MVRCTADVDLRQIVSASVISTIRPGFPDTYALSSFSWRPLRPASPRCDRHVLLADPRQRVADEHVDDPGTTNRFVRPRFRRLRDDLPDFGSFGATDVTGSPPAGSASSGATTAMGLPSLAT